LRGGTALDKILSSPGAGPNERKSQVKTTIYSKGEPFASFAEFIETVIEREQWAFWGETPKHPGIFRSMTVATLRGAVHRGTICRAILNDVPLRMIFPERRTISRDEVLAWARDVFADEAPRRRCLACGAVTVVQIHGKPAAEPRPGEFLAFCQDHPCAAHPEAETVPLPEDGQEPPADWRAAVALLEDRGLATFAGFDAREGAWQ